MRVLLSTWGSRGDVEPLVGLAVRLQEFGAQVRMCVPPDDEFAALLAGAGVPMVPLGPSVRSVVTGSRPPSTGTAFALADELVTARFTTLPAAVEDCDVVVASGLMPAGVRSVADLVGVRYVLACMHVFGLPSPHFPPGRRPGSQSSPDESDLGVLWKEDADRVNALYGESENRHRARLGMPPLDNIRDHVLTDRPWLAADPTLCPGEGMTHFDLVQTGAWIRPDERALPREVEAFLDAGTPPVYVGFGSIAAHLPAGVGRVAIEAIRAHGRRVVLARGWAELGAADGGDDVLVIGEVNQQALFRRVAAVVHHGGAGTTTTAARAGAPQVVVPQIADQPYWGSRVAVLGIGAAHDGASPTVQSLAAALATALDPATHRRARAVAAMIRTDGASIAARMLLDATGSDPVRQT